jgi:hypothetical protein
MSSPSSTGPNHGGLCLTLFGIGAVYRLLTSRLLGGVARPPAVARPPGGVAR